MRFRRRLRRQELGSRARGVGHREGRGESRFHAAQAGGCRTAATRAPEKGDGLQARTDGRVLGPRARGRGAAQARQGQGHAQPRRSQGRAHAQPRGGKRQRARSVRVSPPARREGHLSGAGRSLRSLSDSQPGAARVAPRFREQGDGRDAPRQAHKVYR